MPIDGGDEADVWELDDPPRPAASSFKSGVLGVIRLDYDYPPAPGDVDSPLSYDYRVIYRVVPGLTF